MKILSMYLPQFHRVKENDEWWGEGFTEWTSVKKATPLYEGHYQPRTPWRNNYYDLMNKETMAWQAQLMQQYGIDGVCIYHYWFKNGRQILEKPAENLLEWQDIKMPFCFCWANETWARSWSKISSKNSWTNTCEQVIEKNDNGILLEQKYGEESDWRQHFEYLLPFFKDDRYIKINNMPVFVIYRTSLISCLGEMVAKWREWAVEEGFDGIYVVGANTNNVSQKEVDSILCHEPQRSIRNVSFEKTRTSSLRVLGYSQVWEELLKNTSVEKNVIYGGFVGYDDTPRRGNDGLVIEGQTPEAFRKYFTELIAKNIVNKSPLMFVNAWNEWGEGMYLEPDERHGYDYLEAILYAKEHYIEYIEKYERQLEHSGECLLSEYNAICEKCARYESYWRILDAWLRNKEDNISLEQYFASHGISTVAIYGGGMLGKHLLEELKNTDIKVSYVIDQKADTLKLDVPIYSLKDELREVDAVVVTVAHAYLEIKKQLEEKGYNKILSLENIFNEL